MSVNRLRTNLVSSTVEAAHNQLKLRRERLCRALAIEHLGCNATTTIRVPPFGQRRCVFSQSLSQAAYIVNMSKNQVGRLKHSTRSFHFNTRINAGHPIAVSPEDPEAPPSRLKSPRIPEGHPLDSDGRPIGLFIPDYDVELPASSHRGFAKDFQAWVPPPEYSPRAIGTNIQYDYEELETNNNNLPPVYEVNLVYVLYGISAIGLALAVIGTHIETGGYYAKYGEFYKTGWPLFHYEPVFDIVPLTARDDGKPPESLRIVMHGQQF